MLKVEAFGWVFSYAQVAKGKSHHLINYLTIPDTIDVPIISVAGDSPRPSTLSTARITYISPKILVIRSKK